MQIAYPDKLQRRPQGGGSGVGQQRSTFYEKTTRKKVPTITEPERGNSFR